MRPLNCQWCKYNTFFPFLQVFYCFFFATVRHFLFLKECRFSCNGEHADVSWRTGLPAKPIYCLHRHGVNIFRHRGCHATHSLSDPCKTYFFVFQKRLFCTVKEPILQGKKACFARQKKACELSHVFSLQNKSAGIRGSRRGYGETEDQVQG